MREQSLILQGGRDGFAQNQKRLQQVGGHWCQLNGQNLDSQGI